ncbi:MAG: transglutaminase-like domain-containing protein [Bacteroidales bacterium]|nr:transglutaminase-like domain-containing protein [Bacteroidales bacterium]
MNIFKYALQVIVILILTGCGNSGFISDKALREEVENQFEIRKKMFGQKGETLFSIIDEPGLKEEERDALKFLYAYMPVNDIADYSGDFFLKMVRSSFEARDFFRWGDKVPEELFRHFVLPPRVNNEDLDSARVVFFKELKERIKDLTMYEAALEVNHWCHEKVAYRPSDSRTSSPLATVLSGYGRCGEESTFTVTALRAVGIPARQCYTPRWAHTDDNHAWVEVWCQGNWYFLGACEPESELNKAWFSGPAKRAMMVHTNVFGRYYGPESKTDYPLYTKINVLENYTRTKRFDVTICDREGKRVEGADVKYLLYNYAEFYPIYDQKSDSEGRSYVISGLGDLLVWSAKGDLYGYKKVSLASADSVTIVLDRTEGEEYEEDMDITPPVVQPVESDTQSEAAKRNGIRLKQEDSIRNGYIATFVGRDEAKELAEMCNLDTTEVIAYITKSEGNWREISAFIDRNRDDARALKMLSTISDKDLRDTPSEILQNHLANTPQYDKSSGYTLDVYVKGVLAPRVLYEKIRPWRPALREKFTPLFGESPGAEMIKEWVVKNIKIDKDQNYPRCPISPEGVGKVLIADKVSRDIFYVALCRSFGIPAVIDPATISVKVFGNNSWFNVSFDAYSDNKKTGKVIISLSEPTEKIPQYWSNYTIAKMTDGVFVSLDFENDKRVATFPVELDLEEGYYRICTGNRYDDGRILVRSDYFNVVGGKTVKRVLKIRQLDMAHVVYGSVEGAVESELYKNNGLVICFIDPDKEPTKHLMNEFPALKSELDKWRGRFLFVVPGSKISSSFNPEKYKDLPAKSDFVTKNSETLLKSFVDSSKIPFKDDYPLIFIVNEKGEIIFHSQGYKIGTTEYLHKSLMAEYSYICNQN